MGQIKNTQFCNCVGLPNDVKFQIWVDLGTSAFGTSLKMSTCIGKNVLN